MKKDNQELLREIKQKRCLLCGRHGVDVAHIKSRGSGGSDEWWNLMPLCRIDHQLQHSLGWSQFAQKFPKIMNELQSRGWTFDHHGKLRRA